MPIAHKTSGLGNTILEMLKPSAERKTQSPITLPAPGEYFSGPSGEPFAEGTLGAALKEMWESRYAPYLRPPI